MTHGWFDIDDVTRDVFLMFCAHYDYVDEMTRWEMAGDALKTIRNSYTLTPKPEEPPDVSDIEFDTIFGFPVIPNPHMPPKEPPRFAPPDLNQ